MFSNCSGGTSVETEKTSIQSQLKPKTQRDSFPVTFLAACQSHIETEIDNRCAGRFADTDVRRDRAGG
jgi:hypothetical protein